MGQFALGEKLHRKIDFIAIAIAIVDPKSYMVIHVDSLA
jgi:hypothetical protein